MTNRALEKTNAYEVLVVDDILANLQLLNDILTRQGYKVRPASSGQLALKSVAFKPPDIILLDVKMPDIDGYEVCRILKADEKTRKIPVIFISVVDQVTDKVKGFSLGGVDYITKPFQPEEVIARIEAHLTLGHMHAQLKEQNRLLQKEIAERRQIEEVLRLNQQRLEAIEKLNQMNHAAISEIAEYAFKEAIKLSSSDKGCICFRYGDKPETILRPYSGSDLVVNTLPQNILAYLGAEDGLWADAINQCKAVVINGCSSIPQTEGYIETTRLLVVPVLNNERLVAMITVANKKEDYNDMDILQLRLLTLETWRIIQRHKFDQEHRIAEERFSKAFHSIPALMAILDIEEKRYIDVNERWIRVFGFSRDEVIGRTSIDLKIYVNRTDRTQIYRLVEETGSIQSLEVKYRRKNGDILNIILSIDVIQMDGQRCMLATGIDITDRIRIGEELKQSRQENKDTNRKIGDLKKLVARSIGLDNIYYASESMQRIVDEAQKYHYDRSIPVLIQGETGTGKELIAKLIHFGDLDVLDKPFIDINCAAVSPLIFESEFFGYEPGAFTGGLNKGQIGKFDLARGGTLFLDEIAEIPVELQGKLLRVIQEQSYYRVGGIKKIDADVRIICATNVDIEEKVKQGSFRKDLFYRLSVGLIKIPPLRQRKESVIPLARAFLENCSRQKGKTFTCISDQAIEILMNYNWPGNVRELKNLIEWVVFMYKDTVVQPFHLEAIQPHSSQLLKKKRGAREGYPQSEVLDQVSQVLDLYSGNKSKAARHLGISRPTLYKLLKAEE